MIASSAFVLTALTMTGVYMQSKEQESENDGYTLDFTVLENNVDDKHQQIAENEDLSNTGLENQPGGLEDDLDYLPMEAGSSQIEIPGLTDNKKQNKADVTEPDVTQALSVNEAETAVNPEDMDPVDNPEEPSPQAEESAAERVVAEQELHFSENEGLIRPLSGETLIPFSTETSVYFTTLNQYKRNKAMMISASEGTSVTACAEGKVVDIFQDEEIGHAVTMELGDGYRLTYGQLRDIQVSLGSYVNAGDTIGSVAAPTKYYTLEGSNLYLKLTANNTPVDPEALFQ